MDTKKTLTLLALLIGEAIIIAGFVLFAGHWENSILVLNILVASLIYGLCLLRCYHLGAIFPIPLSRR